MTDLYIYQGFDDDHAFLRSFEAYAERSHHEKLLLTWSGMKAADTGDRILIFDRTRKTLAIAATVAEKVDPESEVATYRTNDPNDWRFRTPLTNFRVARTNITLKVVERLARKWNKRRPKGAKPFRWHEYPRGKAKVPVEIADKLWAMAT